MHIVLNHLCVVWWVRQHKVYFFSQVGSENKLAAFYQIPVVQVVNQAQLSHCFDGVAHCSLHPLAQSWRRGRLAILLKIFFLRLTQLYFCSGSQRNLPRLVLLHGIFLIHRSLLLRPTILHIQFEFDPLSRGKWRQPISLACCRHWLQVWSHAHVAIFTQFRHFHLRRLQSYHIQSFFNKLWKQRKHQWNTAFSRQNLDKFGRAIWGLNNELLKITLVRFFNVE